MGVLDQTEMHGKHFPQLSHQGLIPFITRCFHCVFNWRIADDMRYESLFDRPGLETSPAILKSADQE